jgi:methionyl-tRNA formyltransferase
MSTREKLAQEASLPSHELAPGLVRAAVAGTSAVRTVYLGTSPFAASILEHLAQGPHRPQLVVTRPDRPAGRGRRLTSPPVADTAREVGLDVLQPDDVNSADAREQIATAAPDVLIVCAFGALIRQELLDEYEILNVHPSLLPRWRGAAPIERAIMAGDEQTGVCIMRLTAGLDSGPVGLHATEPITADDTYATLGARLQQVGGVLLTRALDDPPPYVEQDEEAVTYAEKIVAADRTLDPTAGAQAMDRTVRALSPHIGARIALADGTLGVLAAAPVPAGTGGPDGVVHVDGTRLLFGDLELLRVQPPGGKPMDAAAYVRGHAGR